MWLWRLIGAIAFVLGGIGLFLPVWPTTIFWIVAAAAFARSNPAWRDWIYRRPGVGVHVQGFVEHGVLNRAGKTGALVGMSLAGAISAAFLWQRPIPLAAAFGLLALGALFVITRPGPRL